MEYRVRLLDSKKSIADKINQAILSQLETKIKVFSQAVKDRLPDVLTEAIKTGDVYQSLVSGGSIGKNLRAEFGFRPSDHTQGDIDEIVKAIVGQIYITADKIKINSSGPSGRIRILAINKDLQDALDLSQATFESKGVVFPWLDWLSFEGDKIVVSDHEIIYGNFNKNHSRSGEAIMRKSRGFWKVPSAFSGTKDNNWITRAIEKDNALIRNTLLELMKDIL